MLAECYNNEVNDSSDAATAKGSRMPEIGRLPSDHPHRFRQHH